MSAALSLGAAERLVDVLVDGVRAAPRNRAPEPAREATGGAGLGEPGSAPSAAAMTPRELAQLLRGHARDDDGAAFALLSHLGLSPVAIAKILPEARKLIGARR